jgi:hypothetical protein
MQWDFPAPAGHQLSVKLYFANMYDGTENPGDRVFDVNIDGGAPELDNYDIVLDVGDQTGTVKQFDITSDGNVDIDFSHEVENPLINGIEIIDKSVTEPAPGANNSVTRHPMASTGSTGTPSDVATGDEDWTTGRGAFMVDGKVYYGESNGTFNYRTFNGTTFGPEVHIPLDLAKKFGTAPPHTFTSDLPNVTGMVYDRSTARLYYTLAGQSQLFYRYFLPESRIVGAVKMASGAGVDFSKVSGMFLDGQQLYFGDRTTGTLHKVSWNNGDPSGPTTVLATPGHDWRTRAMFLAAP